VVEGARLESEAGEQHRTTPKSVNAHAISDSAIPNYHLMLGRAGVGFRAALVNLPDEMQRRRDSHRRGLPTG
jgi:hypothetical protein